MDSLRALRVFAITVRSGSLSAAGRQIGMSPASVSRHVTSLEDRIGSRLLNRSSRKLTLTEAGELYFQHAEQILHQLEEAEQSVSQLQGSPKGTLRVHSRLLFGTQHLIAIMPEFLKIYPEIKVDLMLSNQVIDLVEQNIDVDIRIGKLQDSSLIAKKLWGSERVLCASPGYLEHAPPLHTPNDLAAHNCLTYRLNMGRTVWRFADSEDMITEIPVEGNFQSDYGPALRQMALANAGIALMPDWSVKDDLEKGLLVQLLPDFRVSYAAFENGVYAVYQPSRYMSAKVRVFIDFLVTTCRERIA
ncbi:LysR family transcriptional regulator [Neorhizobium alkalisoli]|jgi:DNA-binding transcriptional LysR family regulator|uniref:HTH-type transcriptional regulator TtuA n=1 Tax=Neorhizobium alkalisoli TaxID=528178 RepID=A0A561Q839_9HYPH|nr:LysR family transcriptional regulator [Neorhizobium alkalisoli]TWF46497.1 LysR family transcriptional regulator [Neorhizobium alkalisoli]